MIAKTAFVSFTHSIT